MVGIRVRLKSQDTATRYKHFGTAVSLYGRRVRIIAPFRGPKMRGRGGGVVNN